MMMTTTVMAESDSDGRYLKSQKIILKTGILQILVINDNISEDTVTIADLIGYPW